MASSATRTSVDQGYGRSSRQYVLPDGERYDSVTSILSVVGKPALVQWAANQERALCVEAAAALWEDHANLPMTRAAYTAALGERIGKEKAHQKALAAAQEIGTEVHAYAEWLIRDELGETVGPEPVVSDAAEHARQAFLGWWGSAALTPLHVEQVVWSRQYGYAGTADLIAGMPDGTRVVVDFKSGKAIYPEARLQVAAYSAAWREMAAEGPTYGAIVRFPKLASDPPVEALILPPAEQAELFEVFLHVKAMWDWTQRERRA